MAPCLQLLALGANLVPPLRSSGSSKLCGVGISCGVRGASGYVVAVRPGKDHGGLFVAGVWVLC